jgi:hypothetical protein
MVSKNKHESCQINKKSKEKQAGVGGGYPSGGTISHYRSPRHQWRSVGDRMKTQANGCSCCTRAPKAKFVSRLQNKKDLGEDLKRQMTEL